MSTHSKYRSDGFHFLAVTRWLVVAAFLGSAGLSYVYLKNQLNSCCTQRKALEQNLQELIGQNNGLEAKIHLLTSSSELQRRVDEGFIRLVPISTQAVVRIRPQDSNRWPATGRTQESQFQTVSREGFQRP